jgi:hypothetical protein
MPSRRATPLIGADLDVMADSRRMRGDGPFLFAQVTNGVGVADIGGHVVGAWQQATGQRADVGAAFRRFPARLWLTGH